MSLDRVTLTDFHFKRSDHFDLVSWSIKVRGAPFETHGIDHFQLTDGVKLLSTNPSHITPVTTSNVLASFISPSFVFQFFHHCRRFRYQEET